VAAGVYRSSDPSHLDPRRQLALRLLPVTTLPQELLKRAESVLERLWPVIQREMGGQGDIVQGAVLADMVAVWISGHVVPGSPSDTAELQKGMLELHIATVQQLVQIVYTNPPKGSA
jgi:hypothetical protein